MVHGPKVACGPGVCDPCIYFFIIISGGSVSVFQIVFKRLNTMHDLELLALSTEYKVVVFVSVFFYYFYGWVIQIKTSWILLHDFVLLLFFQSANKSGQTLSESPEEFSSHLYKSICAAANLHSPTNTELSMFPEKLSKEQVSPCCNVLSLTVIHRIMSRLLQQSRGDPLPISSVTMATSHTPFHIIAIKSSQWDIFNLFNSLLVLLPKP